MKKIIYLIATVLLSQSCKMEIEEEINWKLQSHSEMIAVECVITNEFKQHAIQINKSNDYFNQNSPQGVSNATITIADGSNIYSFTESENTQGLYLSNQPFACIPSHIYNLSIGLQEPINGLRSYTATSVMPEGIDLDSIICEIYELPEFAIDDEEESEEVKDTTILAIYYFGYEPPAKGNYYLYKAYSNEKPLQASSKEYNINSDAYRNGEHLNFCTFVKNVNGGDNIRFRVYSIEKSFYKFIEGLKMIDQNGNANSMSGPPANAVGNISNGKGLGFFATAYVSEASSVAIDQR